jgi:hypothetical protein
MKHKGLTTTLALVKRLMVDPRLELPHREMLHKGFRELEKLGRSGRRLDREKVERATWLILTPFVERLLESTTDLRSR